MIELLLSPEAWAAFFTLTLLEIGAEAALTTRLSLRGVLQDTTGIQRG